MPLVIWNIVYNLRHYENEKFSQKYVILGLGFANLYELLELHIFQKLLNVILSRLTQNGVKSILIIGYRKSKLNIGEQSVNINQSPVILI